MKRALSVVLLVASAGCGIVHERGGHADDASVPPDLRDAATLPDSRPFDRPDAFVPPPDAWTPPFVIAPHGPEPIVPDQGGARMTHPQLVIITYADDPNRASLEAHARWLASSTWLVTVGAEYGVGSASILGVVERTDSAPDSISGPEIEALLRSGIADGSLPVPAGGALDEALYVVYFPAHTTISDAMLGTSCASHAGYHDETTSADGRTFSYAVLPACGTFDPFLTDVEQEEEAMSHEVIEAATDARPLTSPAFAFSLNDATLSPWLAAGAEIADLCQYRSGPAAHARESGFVATRVWSNAAARLDDRDPCVPVDLAAPYATVSITPSEFQFVPAGSSATFDVAGWSTQPVPSLGLVAFPGNAGMHMFAPGVSIDRSAIDNGGHATLTVTVPFGTPSGDFGVAYVQVMDSMGNADFIPAAVAVP